MYLPKDKVRWEQVSFPETNRYPHNCIGWLRVEQENRPPIRGSAFLVGRSLLLTAAHMVIIVNEEGKVGLPKPSKV
jgi:V8-like Glu-specific endopeptidase